jgi:hypothetical protein
LAIHWRCMEEPTRVVALPLEEALADVLVLHGGGTAHGTGAGDRDYSRGGGVVAGTVEAVLSDALALHGGAGAGTRH